jgi:hypothetical protein
VTGVRERRLATGGLGLLAATLLVAGVLPWVGGGPLAVRLIAVPLLLLGALAGVAAARLPTTPPPLRRDARADAGSTRPARPHQCSNCSCAAAPPPAGEDVRGE